LYLDDVVGLFKHWNRYPPLVDVVRGFAGVEVPLDGEAEPAPAHDFRPREVTEEEFAKVLRSKAAFAAEFGRGNGRG